MPIRHVRQFSDRGSIKNLNNGEDNSPPTEFEIHFKKLYEYAMANKDQALINSLGLIPLNGAANDPVSIFRHREYVQSLSDKLASEIQLISKEISDCLFPDDTYSSQEMVYSKSKQMRSFAAITENNLIKTASAKDYSPPTRSFRRVI